MPLCRFRGCTDRARYELAVRAWPAGEPKGQSEPLVFKFSKFCCEHHKQNPGSIDGLLSQPLQAQMNWGLLSSGKKARDFSTAEFVFEPLPRENRS